MLRRSASKPTLRIIMRGTVIIAVSLGSIMSSGRVKIVQATIMKVRAECRCWKSTMRPSMAMARAAKSRMGIIWLFATIGVIQK